MNLYTALFLEFISQKRETCLLWSILSDQWFKSIESILSVYTDDGGTWYPEACNFLHLKHRLNSPLEKSLIERVMQYFKDRTKSFGFDDYYPCVKNECNLLHIQNWIQFFVSMYNDSKATNSECKIGIKEEKIFLNWQTSIPEDIKFL